MRNLNYEKRYAEMHGKCSEVLSDAIKYATEGNAIASGRSIISAENAISCLIQSDPAYSGVLYEGRIFGLMMDIDGTKGTVNEILGGHVL
jgi:hypothetical protein